MKVLELILMLEKIKRREIAQAELAKAFNLTSSGISKRIERESEITVSELIEAGKYFEVPIEKLLLIEGGVKDAVEIKYCENLNVSESLIKHKKITSIWLDRETVHDVWERDEKDLRCIKMIGDRMKTGNGDSINQGDMIIYDTTLTDTLCAGVYVYTAGAQDVVFISCVEQNMDSSLTFSYRNTKYLPKTRSKEELKELGFKVLGKYIKNISKLDV